MSNFDPNAAANYGAVVNYLSNRVFATPIFYQWVETASGRLTNAQLNAGINEYNAEIINSLLQAANYKLGGSSQVAYPEKVYQLTTKPAAEVVARPVNTQTTFDTNASIVTAESQSVASKVGGGLARQTFNFAPGADQPLSFTYTTGTEATISKTNTVGSATSTGGSSSLSVAVKAGGDFLGLGLETEITKSLTEEWSKVQSIELSTTNTIAVSKQGSASFGFNLKDLQPGSDGKYSWGYGANAFELVPGKQYVAEIRVEASKVKTPIAVPVQFNSANPVVIDDNMLNTFKQDLPATSIPVTQSIPLAMQKGFGSLYGLDPKSYGTDAYGRPVFTASASGDSNTAVEATSTVRDPNIPLKSSGIWVGETVNALKYVAVATTSDAPAVQSVAAPAAVLDVNLDSIQRSKNVGVFLDFQNESVIAQNNIKIQGSTSVVGDHVVVGDKDHSFITFNNSIIEAGNGFNDVVIKEGEKGNTFHLGGGGDTVWLDGNHNFVDAGAGVNAIIIKGKGTNYLATGQGGDVLKFTSNDSMTYVTDYNPNEDRIEFGGDVTVKDAKVVYDSAMQAYHVYANNKEIAYLSVKGDALPSFNNAGTAQGTQIAPVDFNAKTETFIGLLYAEALNRAPDKAAISYWQQKLDGGLSKTDFINALYTSPEFNSLHVSNKDFVDELYIDLLGRRAEAGGEAGWIKALDAGASRASVVSAFTHSDEFVQIVGNPHAAPVTTIAG